MKYHTTFEETKFRCSVEKALERVQTILDTTRQPRVAGEDEDHTYDDKFTLVEFLTNTGIAAKVNALERLGLDSEKLAVALTWVHDDRQSATLRFQAEDSCSFLKENIVQLAEKSSMEIETTKSTGVFGRREKQEKTTVSVVNNVKEHHWNVGLDYQLLLFKGSDPNDSSTSLRLYHRNVSSLLITSGGQANSSSSQPTNPFPNRTVHTPIDVNLSWLLKRISPKDQSCNFSIDRQSENAKKTCRTPRRNKNVDDAIEFEQQLNTWAYRTKAFFLHRVERDMVGKHKPVESPTGSLKGDLFSQAAPLYHISAEMLFGPILPLMERGSILSKGDTAAFLNEQNRSIDQEVSNLAKMYPPRQLMKLISVSEATIVLMCKHVNQLKDQYCTGVDYVENMLKEQFIQAIGKEVNSKDFDQFMRFHQKKMFGPHYAPRPFCYAIRRPDHYPDGVVSIEMTSEGDVEPIETWVRHVPGGSDRPPIFVPISAATSIELRGDCFLHGWMQHRFHSSPDAKYHAVARARQFSSFLLIVGTMMGPDKFEPKNAIILQNNDEVLIPLLTNTLPSAKEFKDAVASLSPEQQDFAKAFRAMQLESSVFGVCVVQLKPQLERLLNLADGALTKEIQLTQELMSLFIEYQIPSDLLSFEGANDLCLGDKVKAVKEYVQAVMTVIDSEKKKQLKEEEMKADMQYEMNSKWFEKASDDQDDDVLDGSCNQMDGSCEVSPIRRGGRCLRAGRSRFVAHPPVMKAYCMTPQFGDATSELASRRRYCMAPQFDEASSELAPRRYSIAPQLDKASSELFSFCDSGPSKLDFSYEAHLGSMPVPTPVAANASGVELQKATELQKAKEPVFHLMDREDFTAIPKILDSKLEKFDTDNALRSTVIKAGQDWIRKRQVNLLTTASPCGMSNSAIETEKKKAFDLLDAISRSGTLPIKSTELHVVIAVSHCFENDIMGTIVQDNINPIAKVERSALLLGSTIFNQSPASLLAKDLVRLTNTFPELLENAAVLDAGAET